MYHLKKKILTVLSFSIVIAIGGCSSSGITLWKDGKVIVSRNNVLWIIEPPIVFDCSALEKGTPLEYGDHKRKEISKRIKQGECKRVFLLE